MSYVLPIALPEAFATERGLVPKHDFAHNHLAIEFGPDGRGYLQSDLFYNYFRYDKADNRDLRTLVITIVTPTFSIERQVVLERETHELTHLGADSYVFNNELSPLAVTSHGEIVLASRQNRIQVYDADLVRIATVDPLAGGPPGLSDLVGLPDGTLIGLRDHDQLVIAEPAPSLRGGLPPLREVATLLDGVGARAGFTEYRAYAGPLVVLDRDRILVSLLVPMARSGSRDRDRFRHLIIDARGALVATLALGGADSPYGKVAQLGAPVAHRPLAAWLVRSDSALHVFARDGERLRRVGLAEDERFAQLAQLGLFGVGPRGELLLVHRKHHTLVVTDPVRAFADLEPALVAASANYAPELARLKKAVPWVGGRFLGYEAHTAPASAAPQRKPAKAKLEPAVAVEPPAGRDPLEAISLQPDLETIAVYGDWLGQAGDPLGELVALSCALAKPACPDRSRVATRALELRRTHGAAWLARWNDPVKLFDGRTRRLGGLPCEARIDALPPDLDAFDRQLRRLPIEQLSIAELGARDIAKLAPLATLHRAPSLWIRGDSKHKLGKTLAAWLVEQQLVQLRALGLSSVSLTGSDLGALVASMPALRELSAISCQLSADAVAAVAVPRIEELSLAYNPIGSAGIAALRGWTGLTKLGLASCDLGDDLATTAPFTLAVRELDVSDNPRLGAAGLRWLVAALPELRAIKLPRQLARPAARVLAPLSHQLESVTATWLEPADVTALVDELLGRAVHLRALTIWGHAGGVAARLPSAALETLELDGELTDADLAALEAFPALRELQLDGTLSDAALARLARSPQLAGLRTLSISSPIATAAGLGRLLAGTWHGLEHLHLTKCKLDSAAPLCVTCPALTLRLWRCEATKSTLAQLRAFWGDRLIS